MPPEEEEALCVLKASKPDFSVLNGACPKLSGRADGVLVIVVWDPLLLERAVKSSSNALKERGVEVFDVADDGFGSKALSNPMFCFAGATVNASSNAVGGEVIDGIVDANESSNTASLF
jgi:hypothetical protein